MAVVALVWSSSACCWGTLLRTWLAPAPAPAAKASPLDIPLVLTEAPAARPCRAPWSTPRHREGFGGSGGAGALAASTAGSGAVPDGAAGWSGVGIWLGTSDVVVSGGLTAFVTIIEPISGADILFVLKELL